MHFNHTNLHTMKKFKGLNHCRHIGRSLSCNVGETADTCHQTDTGVKTTSQGNHRTFLRINLVVIKHTNYNCRYHTERLEKIYDTTHFTIKYQSEPDIQDFKKVMKKT